MSSQEGNTIAGNLIRWVLNPPSARPPEAEVAPGPGVPAAKGPNVAFAHFQGKMAIDKGFHIPMGIWTFLGSNGGSDVSVVHVVAKFKVTSLRARRQPHADVVSERGGITITTVDYEGLLRLLKQSRRRGGWHVNSGGPLAPKTLFIIEVDLDFSAGFFLALHAAVVFSLSITEEKPETLMRLITMSSEPADDLYSRLFHPEKVEITLFQPSPPHEEPLNKIILERGEDPFERIAQEQGHPDENVPHTILYFDDGFQTPPRWDVDDWEGYGWVQQELHTTVTGSLVGRAQEQAKNHMLFNVPCGTRAAGKLAESGYIHLIPSKTRRRPIFDLETRQVVYVDLFVSLSDHMQQLSWVDRTTCGRSMVCVYSEEEIHVTGRRRKNILNGQLAGYIAGLAQFEGWPTRIRSVEGLFQLFAHEHECTKGVVSQTLHRLELQGLLEMEKSETGPIICLRDGLQRAFFNVLPLVDYDTRLAYMLIQPSDDRMTWLKIQVAAILKVGQDELLTIELSEHTDRDLEQIRGLAMTGFTANIARYWSVFTVLGLLKRHELDQAASPCFTNGIILVCKDAVSKYRQQYAQLHVALSITTPVHDLLQDTGAIRDDQFESLCLDFLRAFTFQIGVLTYRSGKPTLIHDFVSGVELTGAFETIGMLDLSMMAKKNPGQLLGFYTTLSRNKGNPMTTISDWNWIPHSIWRRWMQHLEADRSATSVTLRNRYGKAPNLDECVGSG